MYLTETGCYMKWDNVEVRVIHCPLVMLPSHGMMVANPRIPLPKFALSVNPPSSNDESAALTIKSDSEPADLP